MEIELVQYSHGNCVLKKLLQNFELRYVGRIEERMPLMAISMPATFKMRYPRQYEMLMENRYRLTGLKDFLSKKYFIVILTFTKHY
jgi:hypothetical protein